MELKYQPHYVAEVIETSLGDSGRHIKAESEFMPASAGLIPPYLDGLLKFPPPKVGDLVLVIQADSSNIYRWYVPIRQSFGTLSDNSENVQLESEGDIELEGSQIKLGDGATEQAVLGNQLNQWLTDLINQIVAVTVVCTAPGTPSGVPVNAPAITALASTLANILSDKVKVK